MGKGRKPLHIVKVENHCSTSYNSQHVKFNAERGIQTMVLFRVSQLTQLPRAPIFGTSFFRHIRKAISAL